MWQNLMLAARWIYLQHMAEQIRQKELLKQKHLEEIEKKRIQNKKMKQTIKENIEAKRAEKQRQINEEARLLKLKKQYNEQLLAYLNAEQLSNNKSKCDCIKSQHSLEKERKLILEQERKKKLIAELEKKLLEEYRLKEEAEERKSKSEQEEIEIVKRLKTTTQIQQNSKIFLFNCLI